MSFSLHWETRDVSQPGRLLPSPAGCSQHTQTPRPVAAQLPGVLFICLCAFNFPRFITLGA